MPNPKQYHVVANMQQDFTSAEKAQARANIGAAAPYVAGNNITIEGNVINADNGTDVFVVEYGTTTYAQIAQAITDGKSLRMVKTEGPEKIDSAVYGGFNVYPDVNEYHFFSLGAGGQRYVFSINSDDEWNTLAPVDYEGKVFFAEYGRTSFLQVQGAILQKKYVVAVDGTAYYSLNHAFNDRFVFMGKVSLVANVDNFVELNENDEWSRVTASLGITTFTAFGGVTTTDAYNDVGHTDSFAVGQKGTHGGVLDIGIKVGRSGWTGTYKVFSQVFHNSDSSSAPVSGSTSFSTITMGANYVALGTVSQYLLMTGTQWTTIFEVAYDASPGRSFRLTLSGIGSTNITYFAEEMR